MHRSDDRPPGSLHNILQVNLNDIGGGAARIAWDLHAEYQRMGLGSGLAVGEKHSSDPTVVQIPYRPPSYVPWAKLTWYFRKKLLPYEQKSKAAYRLGRWLYGLTDLWASVERKMGREDFNFRGSWDLLMLTPAVPDMLHFHNLHENYFNLRCLPKFSMKVPTVLTLHDAWWFSGHCAHSFQCSRWQTGCGLCPDLSIPPAVQRDATAFNWQRKRKIYSQSRVYVASPSSWLMQQSRQSILNQAVVDSRVIPNGVDLSVFHPGDRTAGREVLGLPQNARILLFSAAHGTRDVFKDMQTLDTAASIVAERYAGKELRFIVLGGAASKKVVGRIQVESFSYTPDQERAANFYRAADVYIHAAKAETFGNVIVEAMACGTPVVATSIGGIPEIMIPGVDGFLTPAADPGTMAAAVLDLITDEDLRSRMGMAAAANARQKYSLELMARNYIDWYMDVIEDWTRRKKG